MNDLPPPGDPALAKAIASRLKVALRAAEHAGAILMAHLGRLESVQEKSPIDLVTVASAFDRSGRDLPADVNGDGALNIVDLVVLAAHFGESFASVQPGL